MAFQSFLTEMTGGANRVRTGDLMNAIHALYQLSYSPKKIENLNDKCLKFKQTNKNRKIKLGLCLVAKGFFWWYYMFISFI